MNDPLAALRRDPAKAGLFLDFDGTLSTIVPVASEARPVEGAPDVLAALARRFGVVAVVSGRSAGQLLSWLGPEVEIWGVHGAERAVSGRVEPAPEAIEFLDLMARVRTEAEEAVAALAIPGALVEDKRVVVALHHRAAEDPERAGPALSSLADELVARHGLRRSEGRMVVELWPPIEMSKAAVVLRRVRESGLEAAAFAGDDLVDLPAFDALDHLSSEGVEAVRIAVASEEAPTELLARADVVVEGPPGLLGLLRSLLG